MYSLVVGLFLATVAFPAQYALALEEPEELKAGLHYAPVVLDGRELFTVAGIRMFPANERAGAIAGKIRALARDPTFTTNLIELVEDSDRSRLLVRGQPLLNVFEEDAALIGMTRILAAQMVVQRIADSVERYRAEREAPYLGRQFARAAAVTLLCGLVLFAVLRIHRRVSSFIRSRVVARLESNMKIQSFSLVQSDHLWKAYQGLMDLLKFIAIFLIGYIYLQRVLNLFPWTRRAGVVLFDVLISPLQTMVAGLMGKMPDLVFLVVLYFIVRYILKVIHAFFASVARGTVQLSGFETEWAMPTYRIIRLLVVVFALVVAYPYIPGSSTNAFKGISVFMGVMLSLGSSSLIANIMAGYSMTYRKAFKVGDRIRVGDHVGDVEEVRMMVTRLRSVKNEEIVIPNSMILSQEVVNFSALSQREGLILYTTVGIGYETPWRQVEALLVRAAEKTDGVEKQPAPFVRQLNLGDFAVTYEINVFCRDPRRSAEIRSSLHRNIQDEFNTFGIQIMTPAYEGDPAEPKIVPPAKWYADPAKDDGAPFREKT